MIASGGASPAPTSEIGSGSGVVTVALTKFDSPATSAEAEPVQANNQTAQNSQAQPIMPTKALPMPGPAKPYYFRTDELTKPPREINDVVSTLNVKLPDTKIRVVILTLLINEKGDIDQVLVKDSELSGEATQLLIEKFSKMKFDPGAIGNDAVNSQMTIEVDVDASNQ